MPNICANELYIQGPAGRVNDLLEFMGCHRSLAAFDFNQLIPYPAEFADRDREAEAFFGQNRLADATARETAEKAFIAKWGDLKDGFNSGGYEWRVQHWGSKWNAYWVRVSQIAEDLWLVTFRTAWSPMKIDLLAALHRKFPELTLELEYFEGGAGFSGGVRFYSQEASGGPEWKPGTPEGEWEGEYHGRKGG